ncbi:MAG: alanine racemase [Bacillota bacterium]|nr:alanine racemase [Bacillota bacterium]
MDPLDFLRRLWACVDLDAIRYNYRTIHEKLRSDCQLMCIIKADGYGHGAVELAKVYEELGTDWFGVSNLEEAMQLRNAGIKTKIFILGFTPEEKAFELCSNNISQAVFSLEYAKALSDEAEEQGVKVKAHIKIDTGMSRIGLIFQKSERDLLSIDEAEQICNLPGLEIEGIFTHFAVSDEGDDGKDFTKEQLSNFKKAIEILESRGIKIPIHHAANSGAISDYEDTQLNLARAGIILYGLRPSDKVKNSLHLKPAMTLKTVISQIKTIEKETTVSYGRTFKAQKPMKIATVPLGYADGYMRLLSNKASMLVDGKLAHVVGMVCMDQTMLDVTHIEDIQRGDEVIVFGSGDNGEPTADDIAKLMGTINYEVVCLIGKRVPRVYIEHGEIRAIKNDIL